MLIARCGKRGDFPPREPKKVNGQAQEERRQKELRNRNALEQLLWQKFRSEARVTFYNIWKKALEGEALEKQVELNLAGLTEANFQEWQLLRKQKQEAIAAE